MKRDPNLKKGPFTPEELDRIRAIALDPNAGYGAIQRLAVELLRHYHSVFRTIQFERQRIAAHDAAIAAIPKCDAMIHSGQSYAALMERLRAEPMPGPDHGQRHPG